VPTAGETAVVPAMESAAVPAMPGSEIPMPTADAETGAVESPAMPAVEAQPVFIADEPPTVSDNQPAIREVFSRLPSVEAVVVDDQTPASSLVITAPMSAGLMPSRSAEESAERLTAAIESARTAAAERLGPPVATDAPADELPTMIVTDQPIAEFAKDATVAGSLPQPGNEATDMPATPPTLRDLDFAVGQQPGNPELRVRRAVLRLEEDQALAAAADFTEALKLEPARIEAYLGRAEANRRLGRLVEAVEDYSIALKLDDHHAAALIERGRCLALLGQTADAERDRAAALALDPSLAKTGPKYGAAFASDSARPQVRVAAPTAFGNLFGETTAGGATTSAEPVATEAVFVSDDSVPQNTAMLAFASDDSEVEAEIRGLGEQIAKTPNDASLYLRRAQAALTLGLAQEAVNDLTAVLRFDPDCGEALTMRCRAYAALGRTAEADADQRRAADLLMTPQ
jgi:tetratricopeptide (TPR) repeat protein